MKPHCWAFLLSIVVLLQAWSPVIAQQEPSVPQVKLTAQQIEGYIAAQKDVAGLLKKLPSSPSAKPDPKIIAQLDGAAKKHGFKDFGEYDDVAANVAMIMAGIDPQTKTFQEPKEAIQQEIAEVNADKSLSKAQKAKMIESLNKALKSAQPIQHTGNIELVKRYFEKIDAAVK
jgi:hypothetical protein